LLDNFKKYLNNVSDNGVGAFAAMMVSKVREQNAQLVLRTLRHSFENYPMDGFTQL
jgi:phosphopantetheine adenylyltransferase